MNLTLNKHNFEFVDCLKEDIGDQVLNYYFEKIPAALKKSLMKFKMKFRSYRPKKRAAGIDALNIEIQNRLTAKGKPIFRARINEVIL